MELITRLNNAIAYVEEHLLDEIDYSEVAKVACCSTYHFQRMFSYMVDIPLSEYIRRRRMSQAAIDLQCSTDKIIDIAMKYGYKSPTAFNRAFQSIHGIAPSLVKTGGKSMKAYPPISFKITINGDVEMEYRIEKKDTFRIIGITIPLHQDIEKNMNVIPHMWQKAIKNGTISKLADKMDGEIKGMLGVSVCNDDEAWKYYIATASNQAIDPDFNEYIIPAATWVIFSSEGTGQSIQDLGKRVMSEWLPTSGYDYTNGPDIEVYMNPDPFNTKYEIWIPVVKK